MASGRAERAAQALDRWKVRGHVAQQRRVVALHEAQELLCQPLRDVPADLPPVERLRRAFGAA